LTAVDPARLGYERFDRMFIAARLCASNCRRFVTFFGLRRVAWRAASAYHCSFSGILFDAGAAFVQHGEIELTIETPCIAAFRTTLLRGLIRPAAGPCA